MEGKALPVWLQRNSEVTLPKHTASWRADYLEKTLRRIEYMLADDTHTTQVTKRNCFFQRLEPHVKLAGAAALLLAAAFTQQLYFLAGINLLLLCTAVSAGVGLKVFAVRVWLPVLVFSGMAVLPGTLSWVTPGDRLFIVYTGLYANFGGFYFPSELGITKQGAGAALFVMLRSAASLGIATLLFKTTRWSMLTKTLAKFRLPSMLLAVLDLTYRYLYLFLLLLLEYIMGRKSRLAGKEVYRDKISWLAGTIADFLRLTREYSRDINQAMQSRGYTGEYYKEKSIKIRRQDVCFLGVIVILSFFA